MPFSATRLNQWRTHPQTPITNGKKRRRQDSTTPTSDTDSTAKYSSSSTSPISSPSPPPPSDRATSTSPVQIGSVEISPKQPYLTQYASSNHCDTNVGVLVLHKREQSENLQEKARMLAGILNRESLKSTPDPKQAKPNYLSELLDVQPISDDSAPSDEDSDDPLYDRAKEVVMSTRYASTSYLQRKLRVGYNRAARLMDQLEENGVISAYDAESKTRTVLA